MALADDKAFGLDTSETTVEKMPFVVAPVTNMHLKRAYTSLDPQHEIE